MPEREEGTGRVAGRDGNRENKDSEGHEGRISDGL